MTIGIRCVGANMGWIGGSPGVAEGRRSPAHSARIWSIAFETPSTAASGSYGMPICLRRSGSPVPRPITNRPGRISSSADPVIARTTGWRVNGLSAPSATRKPASSPSSSVAIACAMAVAKVTPSRSK
ncbi:MAG TPA: hypothetical protein VIM25_09945 [Candidatus Limnocylindrales bacterium]